MEPKNTPVERVSGTASDLVETWSRAVGRVSKGINGGRVREIVEPMGPNADTG